MIHTNHPSFKAWNIFFLTRLGIETKPDGKVIIYFDIGSSDGDSRC